MRDITNEIFELIRRTSPSLPKDVEEHLDINRSEMFRSCFVFLVPVTMEVITKDYLCINY